MKFSTIIPTYKRKNDLRVCLDSILKQTTLPSEVIIIDDDSLPDNFLKEVERNLQKREVDFVYYKKDHFKERRGLSESKNIAINITSNKIFFILDDDLILDNNFFEEIMNVWNENKNKKLIGVGGVIKNNRKQGNIEKLYAKLFSLTGEFSWDVNDVAFQVWNDWMKEREKGYYVHGGVSSYNQSLINSLGGFATFRGGRTTLEDVDFCLRAKKSGYHFVLEPKAKVIHDHSPSGREDNFLTGLKEGYNRKIIFKNNCDLNLINKIKFIWANIGWILKQFLTFQFIKGFGMIKGLLKEYGK